MSLGPGKTAKKSQVSITYDEMFEEGGFGGAFDLPYRHSCYYPMYQAVVAELRKHHVSEILEVGCGSGAFAHMLVELGGYCYKGFDFSQVGVDKAIRRTSRPEIFYVADALCEDNYRDFGGAIVCTEVLEHIPNDLELVSRWPSGKLCVCSVPNFDSPYHERFFRRTDDVLKRYDGLIAIDHIKRIKKPVIADISPQNLLRQLRWNRYRPRRLLELAGLGSFAKVGGWFIFAGERR